MITQTDALNTVEFKDYFVIMPDYKQLEWDKNLFIRKSIDAEHIFGSTIS